MASFQRGLGDPFVAALNALYARGGWLKALFDDPELFVAIRGESVNVYCQGQSLAELRFDGRSVVGRTHYKYLLRDGLTPEMVTSVDGRIALDRPPSAYLTNALDDVASLKAAARRYAGEEKRGVDKVLRANANVIDVEVAVSDDSVAKRMDFAAVRASASGVELFFVEAKLFANPELRASATNRPAVLDQIARYEALLAQYEADVRRSYLRVCQNLVDLSGASLAPRRSVALDVVRAGQGLIVSRLPLLAIYGFDDDQKRGTVWATHRAKLSAPLGDRVLMKGDPTGFTRGISR